MARIPDRQQWDERREDRERRGVGGHERGEFGHGRTEVLDIPAALRRLDALAGLTPEDLRDLLEGHSTLGEFVGVLPTIGRTSHFADRSDARVEDGLAESEGGRRHGAVSRAGVAPSAEALQITASI